MIIEDNPFTGWPVTRFVGEWKTISAWYCDPQYFSGYTHWGIDLAARVTASEWQSIDHAEVVCTANLAVVVAAANDGGCAGYFACPSGFAMILGLFSPSCQPIPKFASQ
jgi:hypothetical protein